MILSIIETGVFGEMRSLGPDIDTAEEVLDSRSPRYCEQV